MQLIDWILASLIWKTPPPQKAPTSNFPQSPLKPIFPTFQKLSNYNNLFQFSLISSSSKKMVKEFVIKFNEFSGKFFEMKFAFEEISF